MKEELMGIVKSGSSIEDSVDWEKLYAYANRYDFAYLDKIRWYKIQCIHILGDDQNEEIKSGEVESGCWLDDEKTWLLIVGPEEKMIQRYISRCTERLANLTVRTTTIRTART